MEPWILEILVCPESRAPLVRDDDWLYSTDRETRRRYAIRDGIPNMLIEESEQISEEEFDRLMRKHDRKVNER